MPGWVELRNNSSMFNVFMTQKAQFVRSKCVCCKMHMELEIKKILLNLNNKPMDVTNKLMLLNKQAEQLCGFGIVTFLIQ